MVRFEYKIDKTTYKRTIPTGWNDITIAELDELTPMLADDTATMKQLVSALSHTPANHIEAFPSDLVDILVDAIQFIWSDVLLVTDMHGMEFNPIGELQVNQFEHWRIRTGWAETIALLHSPSEDNPYEFTQRMAMLDEVESFGADIAVYCRNFYNKSFAEHLKKFSSLYEQSEVSAEEAIAGVEELAKWGVYSTYEELSGGDIFKIPQIAKLPVDEVYYFLMYKKTKQEYQKNLSDAIQRNYKHR